jgi:hypothetical protein
MISSKSKPRIYASAIEPKGEAPDMPLDEKSGKQRRIRVSESPASLSASGKTIDPKEVKTHPTFVDLLAVTDDLLGKIIQDMRSDGFYESEPIVLGKCQGQDPVLIDGHMRIRAALEARITPRTLLGGRIPRRNVSLATCREFADETEDCNRRSIVSAVWRI